MKSLAIALTLSLLSSGCAILDAIPGSPKEPAKQADCSAGIHELEQQLGKLDASHAADLDGGILTCESNLFGGAIKTRQSAGSLVLTVMRGGEAIELTGSNDGKSLIAMSADKQLAIRMDFSTNAMGFAGGSGQIYRAAADSCEPAPISCK